VNLEIILGVSLWAIAEAYLTYLNYLGRVRFKNNFAEREPIKAYIDDKGYRKFSVIYGALLPTAVITVSAYYDSTAIVYGLLGLTMMNAIYDDFTFRDNYLCISASCPHLIRKQCTICQIDKNYQVSTIPLCITEKKVKKNA